MNKEYFSLSILLHIIDFPLFESLESTKKGCNYSR